MGIEIEQYNMYSHPIISGHLDKNMLIRERLNFSGSGCFVAFLH